MTEKIYDSRDEAMEAAEKLRGLIGRETRCETHIEENYSVLSVYVVSDVCDACDGVELAQFKYKTAPKAGTQGYSWNGSGPRPVNAPIYAATGEVDYKGKVFVTSINGGKMSVDRFEPIEPDTELETAMGRILDWMGGTEACAGIYCSDCPARSGSEADCRAAQIANLLRIARGEG